MPDAYIVSATRTAVGKFMGTLKDTSATELGALVVREAVRRAGIESDAVEDVIMGCVLPAGLGQNPARQAAIKGGISNRAGALTINKVCGSGLKSVMLAAQAIRAGDLECVVAGGMESMSRSPHIIPGSREGFRLGHAKLVDSMVNDGLWDIYNDFHMGITAEKVATKYAITRAEQDAYAAESHRKATAAIDTGAFKAEIVPVEIAQRKGLAIAFASDESVRRETTIEALAALKPAFAKDGSVTAGNAPGCNDGAAAFVVVSEGFMKRHNLKAIARICGGATGGMAPEWVMMAPVDAVARLNARQGVGIGHYDLIEYNEAFSVQAIAVTRETGADPLKVNVNGGAVAIGHPIGASGGRVLCTLLHALASRGKRTGLAALCLGGGNAVAMSVEMV